jgi:hypothetical protein
MTRHYLYVALAPSRSATRRADDRSVSRAREFARLALPGVFPDQPSYSDRDLVVFTAGDGVTGPARRLTVHRTGLVELLWAVDLDDDDGRLMLPIMDVLQPVLALAAAAATPEYSQLGTLARPWRRLGKLDWWIAVTTDVPTSDGPIAWSGVLFPCDPPARSAHDRGQMPPGGYGADALRSLRRRKAIDRVPRVLLGELLQANGYFEADAVIEHTLAASHDAQRGASLTRARNGDTG